MSLISKINKVFNDEGFVGIVTHSFRKMYYFFGAPAMAIRIKLIKKDKSLSEYIHFSQNSHGGVIGAIQNDIELLGYLNYLKDKNIKYALEIGTCKGGSLFLLTRTVREDAVITSLDLPGGKFGGGYTWWRALLYRAFRLKNQQLNLLRLDSHQKSSLDLVKKIYGENKLDFLFIDGDHTYNGVSQDFEMYAPLVKEGGLIAFHDIAITNNKEVNVDVFWGEIKKNYQYVEFIGDPKGESFPVGIGIIHYKREMKHS